MEKYGLQGYSRIVYCRGKDLMTRDFPSTDKHDYLLVSILGSIIIVMVIASVSNYLRGDYREHSK